MYNERRGIDPHDPTFLLLLYCGKMASEEVTLLGKVLVPVSSTAHDRFLLSEDRRSANFTEHQPGTF